jgi:hypothetical protein
MRTSSTKNFKLDKKSLKTKNIVDPIVEDQVEKDDGDDL